MPGFERHLRLVTGLVIAAYVTGHFLNHALVSLSRRRTLRMPAWEAAQLVLGLAVSAAP